MADPTLLKMMLKGLKDGFYLIMQNEMENWNFSDHISSRNRLKIDFHPHPANQNSSRYL